MTAEALLQALQAYGADTSGIMERFIGDANFYQSCFKTFFEDTSFAELKEALAAADYASAFEAAHALKGLSGNLGLTPFYQSVCVLVELLRSQQYDKIAGALQATAGEYGRLEPFR